MRSETAKWSRMLMIPAKHARKKMKIWKLLRPGKTSGETFWARSLASVPPSHQSSIDCPSAFGTSNAWLYCQFQNAKPIAK